MSDEKLDQLLQLTRNTVGRVMQLEMAVASFAVSNLEQDQLQQLVDGLEKTHKDSIGAGGPQVAGGLLDVLREQLRTRYPRSR